jgi:GntR family transcriptional regulator/MocR family aminotransferase
VAQWQFSIEVDPDRAEPVFLQIARGIADAVQRGRLRPGDRLPGSRRLAADLELHRNTVIAAYDELAAEGWIETAQGKGTFVSAAVPEPRPRRIAPSVASRTGIPPQAGYALGPPRLPFRDPDLRTGMIYLSGGVPDVRLAPAASLARAYRRAVSALGGQLLGYGDPRGHERLRAALAGMLNAKRGLAAGADDVLVTRGSQMALSLIGRALVSPGDVVAVESLGYRPAWDAMRDAGAKLVPVPVDDRGMRVDRLARVIEREPIRAVYVTPHHQYPTLAVMSAGRRLQLLELARRERFAVIEDDYDNEFHYAGRPVLPLASIDAAGVVIYVGTMSKVLAPGLRIGYVVAPRPLLERLTALREAVDRQGDAAIECAVAELIEDGELQRHARRMLREYGERRDAFAALLRDRLGDAVSFELPPGGMALWLKVARDLDVEQWREVCERSGVVFWTGREYAFDGRARPFARMGYAPRTIAELRAAVDAMARAANSIRRGATLARR